MTVANYVLVPCFLDVAQTTTNIVNAAALYRRVKSQPLNVDSDWRPAADRDL